MIERGACIVEVRCAVHAAMAAVAHRGVLDRSLCLGGEKAPDASHDAAGRAWEGDAVTVSSGHCTSLEKTTPRAGRSSCRGASHVVVGVAPAGCPVRRRSCDCIGGVPVVRGKQANWPPDAVGAFDSMYVMMSRIPQEAGCVHLCINRSSQARRAGHPDVAPCAP